MLYGTDAGGSSTAATVITGPVAASGHTYDHMYAYCATNNALISIDGGSNYNIYLPAAQPLVLDGINITGDVLAKNAVSSTAYTLLNITIWETQGF